jgi:uncharacterized membrane-anchored protein
MPDFPEHQDRAAVLAELHLRPFLQFSTPHSFQHFAFVLDQLGATREHAAFSALCDAMGVPSPPEEARFHRVEVGPWTLRWEHHAEFASYSWSTGTAAAALPAMGETPLPPAFATYRPAGQLLVHVAIGLLPRQPNPEAIEQPFNRTSLAVVNAAEGGARVVTDFQADASGTVRFLVEDLGLTPTRAGRLVQRLLELETYRTLALLGLPVARRAEPVVRHVEEELLRLSSALTEIATTQANRNLLHQLTTLSARLESQIASTSYRFGATRAYAELVRGRLDVIREAEHGGYVSFSRFLRRRFAPAIATCEAVDRRQQALAARLAHAVDLLRTRIQSELEDQNRLLLASMNRRSRMQLRLQQTVEGLSIAAVSYYIVGLVGYVAKGLKEASALPHPITPEMAAGASVPLVVFGVWWMLHKARKAWAGTGGGAEKDD